MDSGTSGSSGSSSGVPVVGYCLFAAPNAQRTQADGAANPADGSITMMDGVSVWSPVDTSTLFNDAPTPNHGSNDGDCYNESKVTVSFCANAITADAVEQLVVKESDCQMQLMTKPSELAVVVE